MNIGSIDYLSKKFDLKTFHDKIKEALGKGIQIKNEIESEQEKIINLKRHGGRIVIRFLTGMSGDKILSQAEETFNERFIANLEHEICILDFRYLFNPLESNFHKVKKIVNLIPDHEIYVICGRNYAQISLHNEFDERVKLFISYEDMDQYNYTDGTGIVDINVNI